MKPDRERTLGGRMRRIEPAAPGGEQGALKDEHDPFAEIKALAQAEAVRELGTALNEGEVVEEELHEQVQRAIDAALAEAGTPLSTRDRARLVREITHNILGYGPIEPFLADDTVTEVMVNNHSTIYVERKGMIEETDIRFGSELHLLQVIDRIVAQIGRRIDESSPMVDARLPDGSRVNAIIPPLAITGPSLTIRKFSREPLTMDNLVGFGTLSHQAAAFLEACVEGKLNMLVSGGTGTGKTTMLNVLSSLHSRRRTDRHHRRHGRAAALPTARGRAGNAAAQHRGPRRHHDPRPGARTRCVCAPTGSSSASAAGPRRSTCCRP